MFHQIPPKIEFGFPNFFHYYSKFLIILICWTLHYWSKIHHWPNQTKFAQNKSKILCFFIGHYFSHYMRFSRAYCILKSEVFVFFKVLWVFFLTFYVVWILKSELYKACEKLIWWEKKQSFSFAFLVFLVVWALDLGRYFIWSAWQIRKFL